MLSLHSCLSLEFSARNLNAELFYGLDTRNLYSILVLEFALSFNTQTLYTDFVLLSQMFHTHIIYYYEIEH